MGGVAGVTPYLFDEAGQPITNAPVFLETHGEIKQHKTDENGMLCVVPDGSARPVDSFYVVAQPGDSFKLLYLDGPPSERTARVINGGKDPRFVAARLEGPREYTLPKSNLRVHQQVFFRIPRRPRTVEHPVPVSSIVFVDALAYGEFKAAKGDLMRAFRKSKMAAEAKPSTEGDDLPVDKLGCAAFVPLRDKIWLRLREKGTQEWTFTIEIENGKAKLNGDEKGKIPAGTYEIFGDSLADPIDPKDPSKVEHAGFLKAVLPEKEGAKDAPVVAPLQTVEIKRPMLKAQDQDIAEFDLAADGQLKLKVYRIEVENDVEDAASVPLDEAHVSLPVIPLSLGINHQMSKVRRYLERAVPIFDARQSVQNNLQGILARVDACLGFWQSLERLYRESSGPGIRDAAKAAKIAVLALNPMTLPAAAAYAVLSESDAQRYKQVVDDLTKVRDLLIAITPVLYCSQGKRIGSAEDRFVYIESEWRERNARVIAPIGKLLQSKELLGTLSRAVAQRSLPDEYARVLYQAIYGIALEDPAMRELVSRLRRQFRAAVLEKKIAAKEAGPAEHEKLPVPVKMPAFDRGGPLYESPAVLMAATSQYYFALEAQLFEPGEAKEKPEGKEREEVAKDAHEGFDDTKDAVKEWQEERLKEAKEKADEKAEKEKEKKEAKEKAEEKKKEEKEHAERVKEAHEKGEMRFEEDPHHQPKPVKKPKHRYQEQRNKLALEKKYKRKSAWEKTKFYWPKVYDLVKAAAANYARWKKINEFMEKFGEASEKGKAGEAPAEAWFRNAEVCKLVCEHVSGIGEMIEIEERTKEAKKIAKEMIEKTWTWRPSSRAIAEAGRPNAIMREARQLETDAMFLKAAEKLGDGLDALIEMKEGGMALAHWDEGVDKNVESFQGANAEDLQIALNVFNGVGHLIKASGCIVKLTGLGAPVGALLEGIGSAILMLDAGIQLTLGRGKTERDFFQTELWTSTVARMYLPAHPFGPPWIGSQRTDESIDLYDRFEYGPVEGEERVAALKQEKAKSWEKIHVTGEPGKPEHLTALTDQLEATLKRLGYRAAGYGEQIGDGELLKWSPFSHLYESLDLEDWWAVLATAGIDPGRVPLSPEVNAPWWTKTIHAYIKADNATGWNRLGLYASKRQGVHIQDLTAEDVNEFLLNKKKEKDRFDLRTLAIRVAEKEGGERAAGLGHIDPYAVPWLSGGTWHAWLIQSDDAALVASLVVHPYAAFTDGHDNTAWTWWQKYVFYPGLVVALPLEYEGAGVDGFQERCEQRGAVRVSDLVGLFFEPALFKKPDAERREFNYDAKVRPVLLHLLGDVYLRTLEYQFKERLMTNPPPGKAAPGESSLFIVDKGRVVDVPMSAYNKFAAEFWKAALDRAYIFVTGPLASAYEKVRFGAISGIIGHYGQVEAAWRETYGRRNFPPTLMGESSKLWKRKMQSLYEEAARSELENYYVYVDWNPETGVKQASALRIAKQQPPVIHFEYVANTDRGGETIYVFTWQLTQIIGGLPRSTNTTVTLARTADGELARYAEGDVRKQIGTSTSEAALPAVLPKELGDYSMQYGLKLPELDPKLFFKPALEQGPIVTIKGSPARAVIYRRAEGAGEIELKLVEPPPGWKVSAEDGGKLWLLSCEAEQAGEERELQILAVDKATGRAFLARYDVTPLELKVVSPEPKALVERTRVERKEKGLKIRATLSGGEGKRPAIFARLQRGTNKLTDPVELTASYGELSAFLAVPWFESESLVEFSLFLFSVFKKDEADPGKELTLAEVPLRLLDHWLAHCKVELRYHVDIAGAGNAGASPGDGGPPTYYGFQGGTTDTLTFAEVLGKSDLPLSVEITPSFTGPGGETFTTDDDFLRTFCSDGRIVKEWGCGVNGKVVSALAPDATKVDDLPGVTLTQSLGTLKLHTSEAWGKEPPKKIDLRFVLRTDGGDFYGAKSARNTALKFTKTTRQKRIGKEERGAYWPFESIDALKSPVTISVADTTPNAKIYKVLPATWEVTPKGLGRVKDETSADNPTKQLVVDGVAAEGLAAGKLVAKVGGEQLSVPIALPKIESIKADAGTGEIDLLGSAKGLKQGVRFVCTLRPSAPANGAGWKASVAYKASWKDSNGAAHDIDQVEIGSAGDLAVSIRVPSFGVKPVDLELTFQCRHKGGLVLQKRVAVVVQPAS